MRKQKGGFINIFVFVITYLQPRFVDDTLSETAFGCFHLVFSRITATNRVCQSEIVKIIRSEGSESPTLPPRLDSEFQKEESGLNPYNSSFESGRIQITQSLNGAWNVFFIEDAGKKFCPKLYESRPWQVLSPF